MRILIVADAVGGTLRDVSLELVAAGTAMRSAAGGTVAVAVVDADPAAHVAAASREGVDEILTVRSALEHFEPHVAEAELEALIDYEEPDVVLLGHTVNALAVAPSLAARRGYGLATDVTGVGWDGELVATRPAHGGKLAAELSFGAAPRVLLVVRAGAFEAPASAGGVPVREVALELDAAVARTSHHGYVQHAPGSDVDITSAPFLLSVGRGLEDEDGVEKFSDLAARMGAVLSASRPLIDAGLVSSERQVGQSGKTVAPRVYLAFGISGAVQHLAGIQKAETVIAVNTDPNAPIFGVADYGAVADMFEIADELAKLFDPVQA